MNSIALTAYGVTPRGIRWESGEAPFRTTDLRLTDEQVKATDLWEVGQEIFAVVWGDRDLVPGVLRLRVEMAVRYIFGYQWFAYAVPEAFWRETIVGREFARALLMTYRGEDLVGLSQAADQLEWRWPRLREALAIGGVELLYDPDQTRLLLPKESVEALRQSRFMVTPDRSGETVPIEEPETGTVRLFNRRSGKTTLQGGDEGRIHNLVRRSRYLQMHGLSDPE